GRPQILQRKIDLVAQRGVSFPDANSERLHAEQVADDLEVGIAVGKTLQNVEAAGQRVDAALRQRQPRAVVILEGNDLRFRRSGSYVLFQGSTLLHRDLLAIEVLEPCDRARLCDQQRLAAGVIRDREINR